MFCNNCGKENPDNSKFCKGCGAALDNSAPQQTFVQQPAGNGTAAVKTKSGKKALKIIIGLIVVLAAAITVWMKWFGGYNLIASKIDKLYDCGEFMLNMEYTMQEGEQVKPFDNVIGRSFVNYNNKVGLLALKCTENADITEEYFKSVCNSESLKKVLNPSNYAETSVNGDIITFTYDNLSGDDPISGCYGYAKFMHKGKDVYIFIFTCEPDKTDSYKDRFVKWADSIKLV